MASLTQDFLPGHIVPLWKLGNALLGTTQTTGPQSAEWLPARPGLSLVDLWINHACTVNTNTAVVSGSATWPKLLLTF